MGQMMSQNREILDFVGDETRIGSPALGQLDLSVLALLEGLTKFGYMLGGTTLKATAEKLLKVDCAKERILQAENKT